MLFRFTKENQARMGRIWFRDNTFICMDKCRPPCPSDWNELLLAVNTILSNTFSLPYVRHYNAWRNDSAVVCPMYRDHVHSEKVSAMMLDEIIALMAKEQST